MVTSKIIANGILRAIGFLVLAAVSLYVLYLIQSILIYLVVALILTLIGNPILDFFKKRLKFKHTWATQSRFSIFFTLLHCRFPVDVHSVDFLPKSKFVPSKYGWNWKKHNPIDRTSFRFFGKSQHRFGTNAQGSKISSKINFNFIPDFLEHGLGNHQQFRNWVRIGIVHHFFLPQRPIVVRGQCQKNWFRTARKRKFWICP